MTCIQTYRFTFTMALVHYLASTITIDQAAIYMSGKNAGSIRAAILTAVWSIRVIALILLVATFSSTPPLYGDLEVSNYDEGLKVSKLTESKTSGGPTRIFLEFTTGSGAPARVRTQDYADLDTLIEALTSAQHVVTRTGKDRDILIRNLSGNKTVEGETKPASYIYELEIDGKFWLTYAEVIEKKSSATLTMRSISITIFLATFLFTFLGNRRGWI